MIDIAAEYLSGKSIAEVADAAALPRSTVRSRLIAKGIQLRDRIEALRAAGPKLSVARSRPRKPLTSATREKISKSHKLRGEQVAKGTRINTNGYVEYTRGPHKGRSVHVVKMEQQIGRRLRPDECVHHIDEDRQNNDDGNLKLMTISEHTRLHRSLDAAAGKHRKRENGRCA